MSVSGINSSTPLAERSEDQGVIASDPALPGAAPDDLVSLAPSPEPQRGFLGRCYDGLWAGWEAIKDGCHVAIQACVHFFEVIFTPAPSLPLTIEMLARVDFTDHWLTCSREGALKIVPKDPMILRWFKTILSICSFSFFDIYGHVKISRVAQGLFDHFKKDYATSPASKELYIQVINNLLEARNHLGKTSRRTLLALGEKVSAYPNEVT